jgi:hypothetical protein
VKLEFLPSGSPECPLIRLFAYTVRELEFLRSACRELAEGRRVEFALHEQPWVEPVGGCKFILWSGPKGVGVRVPTTGEPFVLQSSSEGWREMVDKLAMVADVGSGLFNWLTNEGEIAVLISSDGFW